MAVARQASSWPQTARVDGKIDLKGTVRSSPPAETLARLRKMLPTLGITRVACVTGLDSIGIPTAVSIRPNARHLSTSQGKGLTEELAEISAIMESIEGVHAETVPEPSVRGSLSRLSRRRRVLSPAELPMGMRWKAWSPDLEMRWSQAHDLSHDEPILVPYIYLTMDSSRDHPEFGILDATTNGLASGNTRDEAICHGLFEVIERESEVHWSALPAARRNATLVDPATVDTPFLEEMLDRLGRAKIQPVIWDMTRPDLGIPAYRCILVDRDPWRRLGRFHGSGAHLSKEIALSRALTEAAQARLTWIHGSREDVFPVFYEEQPEIAAADLDLPRLRTDFRRRRPPFSGATFKEDLGWVIERVREAGYSRVIVFDHTRPDLGIPVVLVIVPGMRFSGNRM